MEEFIPLESEVAFGDYKIKELKQDHRAVREAGPVHIFEKQYGFQGNVIVGQITTNLDQNSAVGAIGFEFSGRRAEVGAPGKNLVIRKDKRKRGLGTTLIEMAIEYIEEVVKKEGIDLDAIDMRTHPSNSFVLKIAERLGFTATSKTNSIVFLEKKV